jgi:hypothetical protein
MFRKMNLFVIIFASLIFSKEVTGEWNYVYGDNETISQAKDACIKFAKRNAVESFATYIKSETTIVDFVSKSDEIYAKSESLLKDVKILIEKIDKANSTVYYKISGVIDETDLMNSMKNTSETDSFKNPNMYYYGEGIAKSTREADRIALDILVEQISEDLQNRYTSLSKKNLDVFEFTRTIINTYKNSMSLFEKRIKDEEQKTVLRYIDKKNIKMLFEPREAKIHNFIQTASKAEYDLRIGDALKYYYWAYALLVSHPDYNTIVTKEKMCFDSQLLIVALPDKINSLLNYLEFKLNRVEKKGSTFFAVIDVSFRGMKVHNLNFTSIFKDRFSDISNVISSQCFIELSNDYSEADNIKIAVEYRYEEKTKFDKEVESVIEDVSIDNFAGSVFLIPLEKRNVTVKNLTANNEPSKKNEPDTAGNKVQQKSTNNEAKMIGNNNPAANGKNEHDAGTETLDTSTIICHDSVLKIIQAIEEKNYESVKDLFNDEGYDHFNRIIKYGEGKILPKEINLKSAKINDEIIVRQVPMKFDFPNSNWSTIENVIFTFNTENKVSAISFSLSDLAIQDILDRPEQFGSTEERYQLIQFMENYKTSYCLKNIDYIRSIFAENAIIIVGRVLKQGNAIGEMYSQLKNEDVQFIQKSKKEYMESLELAFQSNDFININFEDNVVKRTNKSGKVYGIQISQEYYSTNYADQGYLFLMMDLSNSKEPKIYVRSWQPQKNPDGSIIGLSDFKIQ